MIDKGGCGHSQEVVRSASGHMGLAAARGGIKLKAGRGRENSQETSYIYSFQKQIRCLLLKNQLVS